MTSKAAFTNQDWELIQTAPKLNRIGGHSVGFRCPKQGSRDNYADKSVEECPK